LPYLLLLLLLTGRYAGPSLLRQPQISARVTNVLVVRRRPVVDHDAIAAVVGDLRASVLEHRRRRCVPLPRPLASRRRHLAEELAR